MSDAATTPSSATISLRRRATSKPQAKRCFSRKLGFEYLEDRRLLAVTPIANGQEIEREVGGFNDPFDDFSFHASAGDTVYVSVGKLRGLGTPRLRVSGPGGTPLFTDAGSNHAAGRFEAPATGEYRAYVSELNNDADIDYIIRMLKLPGEVILAKTPVQDAYLEPGEQSSATLAPGKFSAITFSVESGSRSFLSVAETNDTYAELTMHVYDPLGQEVNFGLVTSTYRAMSREFDAELTGDYTAVIYESQFSNELTFNFSFVALPAVLNYSLPQNTLLSHGEYYTSSLGVGEQHYAQFHAQAGEQLFVALGDTAATYAKAQLRIVNPDGAELVPFGRDYADEGVNREFKALSTGIYTLVISESGGNEPLDYGVSVGRLPALLDYSQPHSSRILSGQRHDATLSPGEQHFYQFYVEYGDYFRIHLGDIGQGPAEPQLRVTDPDGDIVYLGTGVTSDNGGVARSTYAAKSGIFTAVVTDKGSGETLDYGIRLLSLPDNSGLFARSDAPLIEGNTLTDIIDTGMIAIHPFYAAPSQTVAITATETVPTIDYPRLRIFDTSGVQLRDVRGPITASTSFTPAYDGLFYALLSASGPTTTLTYSLTGTGIASLSALPLPGDFNADNDVNGADFLIWQRGIGEPFGQSHLDDWKMNFGASKPSTSLAAFTVVEVSEEKNASNAALTDTALTTHGITDEESEEVLFVVSEQFLMSSSIDRVESLLIIPSIGNVEEIDPSNTTAESIEANGVHWLSDELLESVFSHPLAQK